MATPRPQPERALAEARDPATSPQRLRHLVRHRERRVRAAVAANPNIDLAIVAMIGAAHPVELASNPLLGWLTVEDSDFLKAWPRAVRHRVLMEANGGLLWWAARFGDSDDRMAVLANPRAPRELVEPLIPRTFDQQVAATALAHVSVGGRDVRPAPDVDADQLDELFAFDLVPQWLLPHCAASSDARLRRRVAEHPATPAGVVRSLLIDADAGVRAAALANPNADPHSIAVLTDSTSILSDTDISWLAEAPTGAAVLARHPERAAARALAASSIWQNRQAAAARVPLDDAVARALVVDTDNDVRIALAQNPTCPPPIAALLAHDPLDRVRESVVVAFGADDLARSKHLLDSGDERAHPLLARHPATPPAELTSLADAADWRTRQAVATNERTPIEVLERLASDHDDDVRAAAVANRRFDPARRRELATDPSDRVRAAVARVSDEPELLARLAREATPLTRDALAANPATPRALMRQLAADASGDTARMLVARANLPRDAVAELMTNSDDAIKLAAIRSPHADRALLARAVGGSRTAATTLHRLLHGPHRFARGELGALVSHAPWLVELLAAVDDIDDETGRTLAQSADWRTRQKAAAWARSPILLDALSHDHDYDVRSAVAANHHTTRATLRRLAEDSAAPVRAVVAGRHDVPAHFIAALLFDGDDAVVDAARANPTVDRRAVARFEALRLGEHVPRRVLTAAAAGSPNQRTLAARHPATPARVLAQLARDDNWRVREAVAANPHTDPSILQTLSNDPDRDVRGQLAAHARAPAGVVDALAADPDDTVRHIALRHPALSPAIRRRAQQRALTRLARVGRGAALAAVAHAAATPSYLLARRRMWQSIDPWVRYGLATNPHAPPAARAAVSNDGISWVREAARR